MRSAICLLLATSLLGCATARMANPVRATASGPGAQAADSAGAHRAAVGFIAAFDSLQWEPFRAFLADDITMFFPFPQRPARVDGRQAVEDVFGQFMRAQREARTRAGRPLVQGLAPRDLRIQMVGAGAAVATFHLGTESPARRSLVFRHTAAGKWEVIHWHASPAPQAPAASGAPR
jgi:ketosteroid isomerase-like protein